MAFLDETGLAELWSRTKRYAQLLAGESSGKPLTVTSSGLSTDVLMAKDGTLSASFSVPEGEEVFYLNGFALEITAGGGHAGFDFTTEVVLTVNENHYQLIFDTYKSHQTAEYDYATTLTNDLKRLNVNLTLLCGKPLTTEDTISLTIMNSATEDHDRQYYVYSLGLIGRSVEVMT